MIDAQRLLDQFLGSGASRGAGAPPSGTEAGTGRASTGNTLQEGLGQLLGGSLGSGSRGGSGGGFSGGLSDIAGKLGGGGGGLSSHIPGALAGGLAGYLLRDKGMKKMGGTALKVGGLALVAGLGYKAWTNYQAQQQQTGAGAPHVPAGAPTQRALPRLVEEAVPSAEGTKFLPAPSEADERARLLLSAMIAAAKADGYIDAQEEEAIFGRVDDLQLDSEAKGLLMDEMRRPKSIDDLVARARTPEVAVEVYVASMIAVDADHPAERAYLDMLAARLGLEPDLVAEVRRTADEARAA